MAAFRPASAADLYMADPTLDLARLRRLEVRPAEVFGSAQDAFRGHLATVLLGSLCTSPQLAATGIGF
jgi:hypothetical protein